MMILIIIYIIVGIPVFVKYAIPGIPASSPEYKAYYIEDEQLSPDDVLISR